jgi:GT2 family glycosyltransferase
MHTLYDISVILINYNSTSYTINCIRSLQAHTPADLRLQIVVVDNASEAAAYHELKAHLEKQEHVQLIRSNLNLGFSGGNMMGVQYSNARYLYFLNNDTLIEKNVPGRLFAFMEDHPDAAICSGQMLNGDKKPIRTFNYFPTLSLKLFGAGMLRIFSPQAYPDRKKTYTEPIKVPLVSGASMFVRFSMFAAVGGMDTNYFFYCEEEDLAYTFSKKGWNCYLVNDAEYIHFVSASTTVKTTFLQEYYYSLLYFFSKHYSLPVYCCLKWWYFFKLLKKCYKGSAYLQMAWMIAKGAPPYYSLRFKQKIAEPI